MRQEAQFTPVLSLFKNNYLLLFIFIFFNFSSLCEELRALFQVLWSGKWAVVSPNALLQAVWSYIPAFRGYSQQDAQEFLRFVSRFLE